LTHLRLNPQQAGGNNNFMLACVTDPETEKE
jgi:hypothetical protein